MSAFNTLLEIINKCIESPISKTFSVVFILILTVVVLFLLVFIPLPVVEKEKKMYGYFYTLDNLDNVTCMEEEFSLKFYTDHRVEGEGEALVHQKEGGTKTRQWKYVGFKHGDYISLSFLSKEPIKGGTGVIYLLPEGEEYAGYWLGKDLPNGHRVQCPYLLSDRQITANETCKNTWNDVFDSDCMIIKRSDLPLKRELPHLGSSIKARR